MAPRLSTALLLLLLPLAAWPAGAVYRWTDSQGVVHYDDQSRLQQRLTRSSIARGTVAAEPSATVPLDIVQEVRRRCVDMRERAASMRGAGQLYGTDPNGNVYRLSPRQAALELGEAQREQSRYCGAEAPRRYYRELVEKARKEETEAELKAQIDQASELARNP